MWFASCVEMQTRGLFELKSCVGLTGSLVLWVCYYYDRERCIETEREEASTGRAFRPPVSLHMHIPARCAGGIWEKTEEMNFPDPEQRCQTDACWDRSHTYHAQKWTHLGSNSVCVNTYVFLSDRWVCHVYVSVQRTREYLPSLSISLGCTMSVCFMSCSRCHRRGQKSHIHVIDKDYRMASCRVLDLKYKADVAWRSSQDSYSRIYTFQCCSAGSEHFLPNPCKQEMKKMQRGWCGTSEWKLSGSWVWMYDIYSTCT